MKQSVLLGVTGGIAAHKSLQIVKLFRQKNITVNVVLTKSAELMVSEKDLEKESGNPVHTKLFDEHFNYENVLKNRVVDHIDLADKTTVALIAPATANIIAKIAHGAADDFLTTTILALTCPVLLFPSMNVHMWENAAVRENLDILRKRGYIVMDPDSGPLACGYDGKGRLKKPYEIVSVTLQYLEKNTALKGKKILVTSGGTVEPIDDVRVITNRSSGKMGASVAEICHQYGADVLLIRAKNSVEPQYGIRQEIFETSGDLSSLLQKHVNHADIIFHTAAVSDFSVKKLTGKISSNNEITLTLTPQKKIINVIKKINPKITLIGFKAEHTISEKDLIKISLGKMKDSNTDAMIANDISGKNSGFESDYNEVIVVTKDGTVQKISHRPKREVARGIVDILIKNTII